MENQGKDPNKRGANFIYLFLQALRNITKAFKKVNTKTLKAEAYIPLIYIVFNKL